MKHTVSIVIPCYNQTNLLERNLKYLEQQSYTDFGIILLDDNSTEDYQKIIGQFPNLDISYIRNEKNVGAIKNIFNSILYKTDSLYTLSLHEDDVIHPQYLEKAVEILSENRDIVFVATIADWFKTDKQLKEKFTKAISLSHSVLIHKADFIREILDGKHITFGSVIYRNAFLDEKPDFQTYDVFCDRPFLISLIKDDRRAGLIQDKAIFVHDHGESDTRFKNITEIHGFNLITYYKNNLPTPLSLSDIKKIQRFSTNGLISLYAGLQNKKINLYQLIQKGKKLGLINFRYINRIGIASLFKLCFGEKIFNTVIKIIKR